MICSICFTSEGRIRAVMYMPCVKCSFWAKTGKTYEYFLRFDIKLMKSHSGFDLVTVLISKQSFFENRVWPVWQGKSYLHGIALPEFYIIGSFFYKKIKTSKSTYLCLAFLWQCHYRERSQMWWRNKFTLTRFRRSSADAHPRYCFQRKSMSTHTHFEISLLVTLGDLVFIMPKWYIHANLVPIRPLVHKISCRQSRQH